MLKVAALLREEAVAFVGLLLILNVSLIERRGQSTTYESSDPARASGDTKLMPTLTTLRLVYANYCIYMNMESLEWRSVRVEDGGKLFQFDCER